MSLESKFVDIKRAISELNTSQVEIKEALRQRCDIEGNIGTTVESIEALDRSVTGLETQIEEQSGLIKEVTTLAIRLLEQVDSITNRFDDSNDITQQVANDGECSQATGRSDEQTREVDENCVSKPTQQRTFVVQHVTEDAPIFRHLHRQRERSKSRENSKSDESTNQRIEKANNSTNQNTVDIDQQQNNNEVKLTESANRDIAAKSLFGGLKNKDDTSVSYKREQQPNDRTHCQKDNDSVYISSTQSLREERSNNFLKEQSDTKYANSTPRLDPSLCITSNNLDQNSRGKDMYKNEFGYKQKLCTITFDNRVCFHAKQNCFEGVATALSGDIPTDPHEEPNIKIEEPSFDSLQAEEFADPSSGTFGFDQPKTITEWLSYADQIRVNGLVKRQTGAVKRGIQGHDYVLVLDCSARMKGQKFITMINAVKTYINGIKEVAMTLNLEDNVGIAVFGDISTVIAEPTCDYNKLLLQIDQLKPGGDAPLVGGLLMGLAGVLGCGSMSSIGEFEIQGYAIVFTDNSSENTTTALDLGLYPAYSYSYLDSAKNAARLAEARGAVKQIADSGMKLFYVPVEEYSQNQIMDIALQHTNGKIVKPNEMYRLVRMTQTLLIGTRIASELRFQRSALTRDMVKERMTLVKEAHEHNEDCIDLVLELADPLYVSSKKGLFIELSSKTLSLGDRVKRGPNWVFGEQDSRRPGTVVGENELNNIWVRWDSGDINVYVYDENIRQFSIEKINSYRMVVDELVAVGCRVERGNDWTYDNEDGGHGSQGTVLKVNDNGSVIVRWDCRKVALYRMGQNGLFEVKLSDESNLTPGHLRTPNPDIVNEDDIRVNQNNTEDIKIDKYIIPVKSKTEVKAVWEYKDNDEWTPFSPEIQIRLEKYYSRTPNGKPLLEIESVSYSIDFRQMKKIHINTKEKVDIQRRSLSES